MNTDTLINCYKSNRNWIYLCTYPKWLKKSFFPIVLGFFPLLIAIPIALGISKVLACIIILAYFIATIYTLKHCSKHLFKIHPIVYKAQIKRWLFWTEADTIVVQKQEIKKLLDNTILNIQAITMIKKQLLDIANEKERPGVLNSFKNFSTVFLSTIIMVLLKAVSLDRNQTAAEMLISDLRVLCLVFCVLLMILLIFYLVDEYRLAEAKRLKHLLRIIETLEVEGLISNP